MMGPQQEDWLRLFMVPGMVHCGGGPGPNQVNWMAALERWRESGIAPDRLIASRVSDNRVNMTRPACPNPQVAQHWRGENDDAATGLETAVTLPSYEFVSTRLAADPPPKAAAGG